MTDEGQPDLLEEQLDARGQVLGHEVGGQASFQLSKRRPMIHGYRVADPARILVADEPPERVDVRRPPVGGQPGDLSFVPLGLESAQRRDIGVEVAQGVEAVDRAQALQSTAASFVHAS